MFGKGGQGEEREYCLTSVFHTKRENSLGARQSCHSLGTDLLGGDQIIEQECNRHVIPILISDPLLGAILKDQKITALQCVA